MRRSRSQDRIDGEELCVVVIFIVVVSCADIDRPDLQTRFEGKSVVQDRWRLFGRAPQVALEQLQTRRSSDNLRCPGNSGRRPAVLIDRVPSSDLQQRLRVLMNDAQKHLGY
jgi:hypothetical protein